LDPVRRHALGPDGLPDARRAVVPDAAWAFLPVLLAPWLVGIVRVVLGTYDEHVGGRAPLERIRDVGGEGGLPADVRDHQVPVAPHAGPVVDRSEVHEQP